MAEEENDIPNQQEDDDKKTDVDIGENGGKKKFKLSKRMLIYIGIGTLVLIILIVAAVILFSGDDKIAEDNALTEEMLNDSVGAEDTLNDEITATDTEGEIELPALSDETSPKGDTEQVTLDNPDDAPLDFEGDRLGAISHAVKTSGLKEKSTETADMSETVKDVELDTPMPETKSTPEIEALIEPEPEMDELTRLRQENEALKKKISQKEGEIIRLEYISRTNALEKQFGSSKQKVEQPLDIELNPKWGEFKDTVPKEAQ